MSMLSYKKTALPNGVRVILAPLSNTRAVTVLVLLATGSKYEEKRINGISHFLEHMFFKGTKKRPDKREIAELLDGVGAEFNAFTSEETTGYYVKVERGHVSLALDVVSDILLNSTFPSKEMVQEKKVIFEEINMIADNPMRQIQEHWQHLLYGDQPAGRPIAGTKGTVSAISRRDLTSYFRRQYKSQSMVVCVAGNFSTAKVRAEIKRRFAGVGKGAAEGKMSVRDHQNGSQVHLVQSKTGQTHILLGSRAFSLFDERRYPLAVLATILGGGMSSRLFLSVREDKGLVYYIRTQSESDTDTGYLVTSAGVDNARIAEAVRAIMKEYRTIKENRVTAKELRKAKNAISGRILLGLEGSDEIAGYLAAQEILENAIRDPEEEMRRIGRVTAKDVQETARAIFSYDKMNLVVLGPHKDKEGFLRLIREV